MSNSKKSEYLLIVFNTNFIFNPCLVPCKSLEAAKKAIKKEKKDKYYVNSYLTKVIAKDDNEY